MHYCIFSINDDRKFLADNIRAALSNHTEVNINTVGPQHNKLKLLEQYEISLTSWKPKQGELGVWLSTYHAWLWAVQNQQPIMVFEDDAIVPATFDAWFEQFDAEYDVFALYAPPDQLMRAIHGDQLTHEYYASVQGNTMLAYQRYSCVAMLYTPQGAAALIKHLNKTGITEPVDCWIFNHNTPVTIRTPIPQMQLMSVNMAVPTTIHDTELV